MLHPCLALAFVIVLWLSLGPPIPWLGTSTGACCCGTGTGTGTIDRACTVCSGNVVYKQYTVTVSGVSNGPSGYNCCAFFNTTFLITLIPGTCSWIGCFKNCTYTGIAGTAPYQCCTLGLSPIGGGNALWDLHFAGSVNGSTLDYALSEYQLIEPLVGGVIDCLEPKTLSIHGPTVCNGWPATVTIQPVL